MNSESFHSSDKNFIQAVATGQSEAVLSREDSQPLENGNITVNRQDIQSLSALTSWTFFVVIVNYVFQAENQSEILLIAGVA